MKKISLLQGVVCGVSILLIGFQILLTPRVPLFSQPKIAAIEEQRRMNDYPPYLYRLAHIIEGRPESRILRQIKHNFFLIFDLSHPIDYALIFTLIGVFELIKTRSFGVMGISLLLPIIVLTILGPDQPRGNFCLYPFMALSTYYGVVAVVKKK